MKNEITSDELFQLLCNLEKARSNLNKLKEALNLRPEECHVINAREDEIQCFFLNSLQKDYEEFFNWGFGEGWSEILEGANEDEVINLWKQKHPDLPVPRVFLADQSILNSQIWCILLFMDAYHFFLCEKDKK